jgi:short-subunit dehydrogenase
MAAKLCGAVVVITGASSGIGRAAALLFAEKGAHLVLGARRDEPLADLARACEQHGVRALPVVVDTTDEHAVGALAQHALDAFGRIDVWVNNAAVYMLARFGQEPLADVRRVLDVNIMGYIHGARTALPIFRRQRRGTLINVGSVNSLIPAPYTSVYCMSKHAVLALSGSLRQELMLDGQRDVHVCTVMPNAIDTPIFEHAANHTGRAAKALPPVSSVRDAAATIVALAERPRREAFVGAGGHAFAMLHKAAPALVEAAMAWHVELTHLHHKRPAERDSGNLHHPVPEGDTASGGWNLLGLRSGHPSDAGIAPRGPNAAGVALVASVALLGWRALRRQR